MHSWYVYPSTHGRDHVLRANVQICRSIPVQGFIWRDCPSIDTSMHFLVLTWYKVLSCNKMNKHHSHYNPKHILSSSHSLMNYLSDKWRVITLAITSKPLTTKWWHEPLNNSPFKERLPLSCGWLWLLMLCPVASPCYYDCYGRSEITHM